MKDPNFKTVQFTFPVTKDYEKRVTIHNSENDRQPIIEIADHSIDMTCVCGGILKAVTTTEPTNNVKFTCTDSKKCSSTVILNLNSVKLAIKGWD